MAQGSNTIDTSLPPYYDKFDQSKKIGQFLFQAGRPVFQSELNGVQSLMLNQVKLLGDSLFKDGNIISGMGVVPQGKTSGGGDDTSTGNPNLVSVNSVSSYNSKIDISKFKINGEVDITATSSQAQDYPGFNFASSGATDTNITYSMKLKRTAGNLYKFAGIFDSSLSVVAFKIDGRAVKNAYDSMDSSTFVDNNANQINLNDGNEHTVAVTFGGATSGNYPMTMVFNPGYNALQEGAVSVEITELKVEDGQLVTPWRLSGADVGSGDLGDRTTVIRVQDGLIYLGGMIRVFNENDINITGSGEELIGVNLVESIVTAQEDSTLLDQTQGAVSQWDQGSDRKVYEVELAYNDPNATTIYTLHDGEVVNGGTKQDYSTLNDILAQRTRDESGSYRVSGFNMWSQPNQLDSSKIDVIIDSGKAYVQGYQIYKTTSTTVSVDTVDNQKAEDTTEGFYYSASNDDNGILNNQPVKTVSRVSGFVLKSGEQVTRSTPSSVPDMLSLTNVYNVKAVYQIDSSTEKRTDYVAGVDYKLQNGNQIVWDVSSNSHMPASGSSYQVDYEYNYEFKLNQDYKVAITGEGIGQKTKVSFVGLSGVKPEDNSIVTVAYEYYLTRIDMVTLDKDGDFRVISGQPAKASEVTPPLHQDPLTLRIGYITVQPLTQVAGTQVDTVTRIPFSGLQDLVSRVDVIEYNESINALRQNAMANQNPVNLRNIFSDGFTDVSKADLTHVDANGKNDFNAAFEFEDGAITLPFKAQSPLQPGILDAASSLHKFDHMITAPFTEVTEVSQPLATGVKNINPYNVFRTLGTLKLNPAVDNWIDYTKSTVFVEGKNETINMGRWWMHQGKDLVNGGTDALDELAAKGIVIEGGQSYTASNGQTGVNQNASAYTESVGSKTVSSVIEYMRKRTVNFEASNLQPMADNLVGTFDGQTVALTPAKGYSAGSTEGSIRSDVKGTAKGTFEVPGGVRTGTREFRLANEDQEASAVYTAQGTLKDSQTIITRTHVTVHFSDPLAESFNLGDTTKYITSVDLFFATKAATNETGHSSAVTVQIREMSNDGYPTRNIIGEQTIMPDDIKTSADASVATRVTFPDPITSEAGKDYAVVLITDSDSYNMYIATQGQKRIDNPSLYVNSQPYVDGTLFASANGATWSAIQESDLKFNINTARFNDKGVVMFDTIYPQKEVYRNPDGTPQLDEDGKQIPMNSDMLVLLASYLTPNNTGMSWSMKLVTNSDAESVTVKDKPWEPIANYVDKDLLASAREVQLKAEFVASKFVSPILAADDLTLAAVLTNLSGSYISRNIEMGKNSFNHLTAQYDAYIPQASGDNPVKVSVKYSTDGGKTWNAYPEASLTIQSIDRDYVRYKYHVQTHNRASGDLALDSQFKTRVDMSTPTSFLRPRVKNLMTTMSITESDTDAGDQGYQG